MSRTKGNQYANASVGDVTENMIKPSGDDNGFKVPAGYRLVPDKKNIRMIILMSEYLKSQIKNEAAERDMSMNELVNQILTDYFKKNAD